MAFSTFLSYLSGNISVLGLYTALVLTVAQLVRMLFKDMSHRVIYEEMPKTNELSELCQSKFYDL